MQKKGTQQGCIQNSGRGSASAPCAPTCSPQSFSSSNTWTSFDLYSSAQISIPNPKVQNQSKRMAAIYDKNSKSSFWVAVMVPWSTGVMNIPSGRGQFGQCNPLKNTPVNLLWNLPPSLWPTSSKPWLMGQILIWWSQSLCHAPANHPQACLHESGNNFFCSNPVCKHTDFLNAHCLKSPGWWLRDFGVQTPMFSMFE